MELASINLGQLGALYSLNQLGQWLHVTSISPSLEKIFTSEMLSSIYLIKAERRTNDVASVVLWYHGIKFYQAQARELLRS